LLPTGIASIVATAIAEVSVFLKDAGASAKRRGAGRETRLRSKATLRIIEHPKARAYW
jgi:hypothetical protein